MEGLNKRRIGRVTLVVWLLAATACTEGFRRMNTDGAGVTDEEMQIDFNDLGYRLRIVQQGIYFNYDFGKGKNWPFQLMQNLTADLFSGYMHDAKPLNGGSHNSDYNLQDGWNGAQWVHTYAYVLPLIFRSEALTREAMPPFYGITKILKVLMMHRVTDYYGPIVYTRFGSTTDDPVDSQAEAYDAFFRDLDEAVVVLADYWRGHPGAAEFRRFDLLLDGDYRSWVRLANSLRMRLAVRIAGVDPERGENEFGKALANEFGVFESAVERAAVSVSSGYVNPLGVINRTWKEVFLNASMESILNGYEDPRRSFFFEPVRTAAHGTAGAYVEPDGAYRGIRQGTCFSHNRYGEVVSPAMIEATTDAVLLTAAEVWFLRAEAALRGWSGEDAGVCYEGGIRASFAQWGAPGVREYLQSDRLAADFRDALDALNDIAARCRVSPRWIGEADPETKLEKILTQKWLALFPEGCEAWAEQRRTGYPRLFPVRVNNSGGTIDTEVMIRRLPFPGSLESSDPVLYRSLTRRLEGADNGGTRLWWDTGRNF